MRAFTFLAAAVSSALLASATPLQPRQQVCNGKAEYCSRQYSNVSLVGAHDSAFVGSTADPRVDQELNITAQLNAGLRYFEIQTHYFASTLSLCHTSCWELYAGPLQSYLSSVKTWLDANPNDVVTILVSNGDNKNVTLFDAVFKAAGLSSYAFVPSTTPHQLPINSWPTLAEMVSAGTRLVVFMDYQANMALVPYILDEYTYYFSTPYDTTDPTFPECTKDAPTNAGPDGLMYIVNHFLDESIFGIDIPDNGADYQTNAATGNGSIGAQVALCENTWHRTPNVVLVDMFDRGNVFAAQSAMNNVS